MIRLAALVGRSFGRVRGALIALLVFLAILQNALVLIASSQQQAQTFDLIARLAPDFVQRQFGSAFPVFVSFPGLVSFAFFHPVVMLLVAIAVAFVGTELIADVEDGHVDLLLARAMPRSALVTRSLVCVLVMPVACVAVMLVAEQVGLRLFAPRDAPWPSPRVVGLLAVHLVTLGWSFGALGLALASGARRRMTAMTGAAIVAVASYLAEVLGSAWRPLSTVAVVSPFHYYRAPAILGGNTAVAADLSVLALMAAALTAIAYWRFSVRDV